MPAAVPPIERGQAGMTRRNHLVERNRALVAKYEPMRQAQEEEELRVAGQRAAEKRERVDAWKASSAALNSTSGQSRPLPGAAARSQRTATGEAPVNVYQQQREEEARKAAEYRALYKADMKEQCELRKQTLQQMKNSESEQMAALNALNAEADQKAADADFRTQEENRAYMDRVRQSNVREQAARTRRQQEQEQRDLTLQRVVNENNRHRAEMDERRAKNMTKMLKIQNEEAHKMAKKRSANDQEKNASELAALVELDRQTAEAERAANAAKTERFRKEFDDCVEREKEFRRTHNYDEPEEVTRRRNELASQSYRLMQQEESLRGAQRRAEYESELMDQIVAKQQYAMTHLDDL